MLASTDTEPAVRETAMSSATRSDRAGSDSVRVWNASRITVVDGFIQSVPGTNTDVVCCGAIDGGDCGSKSVN